MNNNDKLYVSSVSHPFKYDFYKFFEIKDVKMFIPSIEIIDFLKKYYRIN